MLSTVLAVTLGGPSRYPSTVKAEIAAALLATHWLSSLKRVSQKDKGAITTNYRGYPSIRISQVIVTGNFFGDRFSCIPDWP